MASTAIALCSRALIKIGAQGISSFHEGTAEADVAFYLYGSVRDAMLSAHPWRFATAQTGLALLEEEPLADYQYAFALPADFLRAISCGSGRRGLGVDYRIHENKLHANQKQITLTYIFRPQEINFPPFFDQALIARLAAEFCLPLTESTSRAEYLTKAAEDEFKNAKLIDGQQSIPNAIWDFPLIGVRG